MSGLTLEGKVGYVSGPPISLSRAGITHRISGPGGTVFINPEEEKKGAKILASYTYNIENAELIATTFNAAKLVKKRGIDPIEAVSVLPALVEYLQKNEGEDETLDEILDVISEEQ